MEKKKIIIVDDEEDFLVIAKLNLEDTGKYQVLSLPNAKDILSHVHSFKPDVILLDLLMPAVGGFEACNMLRNDPVGRDIPIIIVSALDNDENMHKAFNKGATAYLIKPVSKDALVDEIEKTLAKKSNNI